MIEYKSMSPKGITLGNEADGGSPRMRLYNFRGTLTITLMLGAAASFAASADSRLADAAMRGDRETLRSLLTDRSNINTPQIDGTTALHWAVRKDDLATADALIKAGADVKAANR